MRELRFLKQLSDGEHLVVETADGGEQFLLAVDVPLRDAVRSDLKPLTGSASGAGAISPRDIQMRVRTGASPQALAEEHHARLEWVLRFATPVLEERARIADEARRAKARRSTSDGQSVIFGEAVDERFAAHGVDPGEVRWDARRRDDGQWRISAHWRRGEDEHHAEWALQLAARLVAPVDEAAADLLSDRPIRPITPNRPPPPETGHLSLSAAPPLRPGVVAFPAMSEAHTGPIPHLVPDERREISRPEPVFDQDAVVDPPSAAEVGLDALFEPPLPEPGPPDTVDQPASAPDQPAKPSRRKAKNQRTERMTNLGVAARTDEPAVDKSGRPHVPSWDDILLGVRRKQD